MNQHVLIVMPPKENPEQLRPALEENLLSATFVQSTVTATQELKAHNSGFILLDMDMDGALPFLEQVTAAFYDPPPYIIAADVFSCSMAQADVLNLGADACVGKPIDEEEVHAVIHAALRRADRLAHPKPIRTTPNIKHGALQIDPQRHNVTLNGIAVALTAKEFDILHLLASYPGVVFSKAQIYERVWGEDYGFASTNVSDIISSIRKKLGLNPREGRYIQTVHGVGYRFVEPE